MDAALDKDLAGWIGRVREIEDEFCAPIVRRLAATVGRDGVDLSAGAPVPPHWASVLFDDAQPPHLLGPDGHPAKGDFLPPVPLPRRMLAGRRVAYLDLPRIGDRLVRRSEIAAIVPKTGRSGRLIFVTVRHSVLRAGEVIATEEQDIAYREADTGGAPKPGAKPEPGHAPAWREDFTPDPVLLFRYSALAFNGHRIHYDADYARDVEGYPALVVNGSVTTLMLLEAALRRAPSAIVRNYEARTLRPVFCDRLVRLCGTAPDAEGRRELWAEDETGEKKFRMTARIA